MSVTLAGRIEPSFLFQAGSTDFAAAVAQARETPDIGVVLTGSEVGSLRGLSESEPNLVLVIDDGSWRDAIADVDRPLSKVADDGLFGLSLDEYTAALVDEGATAVLSPTRAIRREGWQRTLASLFTELDKATRPELIPHLPLQSSILDEDNLVALRQALDEFGRPVSMTLLGGRDSMVPNGRLASLRHLVADGWVQRLFATEPLIAADTFAHGAASVAVGINSGLRVPSMPGGGGRRSPNFELGVFHRPIMEICTPTVFAEMYASRPDAPSCIECGGRSLTIYRQREYAGFVEHNLHAFTDHHNEVAALDPQLRRGWLAQERASALAGHPLALVRGAGGPNRTLVQLVKLDGLTPEFSGAGAR